MKVKAHGHRYTPRAKTKDCDNMICEDTDGDNPAPLKIHRQRGPRIKSSNPAVRRDAALNHLQQGNQRRQRLLCRHIVQRLLTAGEATSDECTGFDDGDRRRLFVGAAFAALRKAGVAVGAGWIPSRVPKNHCRPVVRWALANADIARQWLADHPAPPPAGPPVQLTLGMEA